MQCNDVFPLSDLTHPVGEKSVAWPTASKFRVSNEVAGQTEAGYWYEARDFSQVSGTSSCRIFSYFVT